MGKSTIWLVSAAAVFGLGACTGLDAAGGEPVEETPRPPIDGDDSDPVWAGGTAPPADERSMGGAAAFATGEIEGDISTCFDGLASGGDADLADCDDPACAGLGACRIGSGDFCGAQAARTVSFLGCSNAVDCVSEPATEFGVVTWIDDGLNPGGDGETDAGLLLTNAMDLTSTRVQVDLELAAEPCTGPCTEVAGAALTAQASLGASARVRPIMGLQLGAARSAVSLVRGDEVVAAWEALPGSGEQWSLVARPTGRASVLRNSIEVLAFDYMPVEEARVVLYGRNPNRSATDPPGTRIRSASITEAQCDMPSRWNRERTVVRESGSSLAWDSGTVRGVTVATGTTRDLALSFVDLDDSTFFGTRAPDETELELAHDEGTPALRGIDGTFARDPELFRLSSGEWALLFTAHGDTDATSIGLATQRPGDHVFDPKTEPVLDPETFDQVIGFEMPTAAVLTTEPAILMVVRANGQEGSWLMSFLSRDDGETWSAINSRGLTELTWRPYGTSGSHFDGDEIAHPSLVVHDAAYRLYYAGRRGTRWGIGLLASDGLIYWRDVGDGEPVLGRGQEYDRLGALESDVVIEDGVVELFYVGTDGARSTLGRALGSVPTERGFP